MGDSYADYAKIEAYGTGCDVAECLLNPFYPEAEKYCERCAEERE